MPVVNVSQKEGRVTVLWTARRALMRRAVGPFLQAPPAGMAWLWVEPGWAESCLAFINLAC